MRIAVSGTHCSGKSTLIEDFVAAHREYVHEPEPAVWLEELYGEPLPAEPGVEDFYRQLEISVERLRGYGAARAASSGTKLPGRMPGRCERDARPPSMIAERSPVDFVAYMLALGDLGRGRGAGELLDDAVALAASGMAHLDLLVVLPLNEADGIEAPEDEDPELREAMNERLVEIVTADAFDLLRGVRVVDLHGSPRERLAALESIV